MMWISHIIKQIRFWTFTLPSDPKALLGSPRNEAAFDFFLLARCEFYLSHGRGGQSDGLTEPQFSAAELFYSKPEEWYMVWTPNEKREANLWRNPYFFQRRASLWCALTHSLHMGPGTWPLDQSVTHTVTGGLQFCTETWSEWKAPSQSGEKSLARSPRSPPQIGHVSERELPELPCLPWRCPEHRVTSWGVCSYQIMTCVKISYDYFHQRIIIISPTPCDGCNTEEIEMEVHFQWDITVWNTRKRHLAKMPGQARKLSLEG